jgi:hypothetical protein
MNAGLARLSNSNCAAAAPMFLNPYQFVDRGEVKTLERF